MAAAKINNPGILRGAATIMAANMAYFLCGAGGAQHDYKGDSAPMPGIGAMEGLANLLSGRERCREGDSD